MGINSFRSLLYKTAKMLGDVQAVSSGSGGKLTNRVKRRAIGKITGRGIGKLFKR